MKIGRKYIGILVMGVALTVVPSCTDTWNEHYATEDIYTAKETIWETIESRGDMQNFAELMKLAKFYRDENHPAYTINEQGEREYYTYAKFLDGYTAVTVWAFTDDALSEDEWKKWKDMAINDGYNFQQQFIGNHMSLARRPMTFTGVQSEKVRLVNNKLAELDYAESTFANVKVVEANIGTSNGLMHIIEKPSEFDYNIYEYIKFSNVDYLSKFSEYFVKRDTTYFLASSSIEGLPDENGNPTYVDSVYFMDNMNFRISSYNPTDADATDAWMNNLKMMKAHVNVEDSAYIVVIPTDQAWDAAVSKLTPYYNYVSTYPRMDKLKQENARSTKNMSILGARKAYMTTDGSAYETVDSLRDVNITMDIATPMAFNLNEQPQLEKGVKWTMEDFLLNSGYLECEYLLNTLGDTIFNIAKDPQHRGCDLSVLFAGVQKKMSNGYVIEASTWNVPEDIWNRAIDVECTFNDYYKSSATLYAINPMNNTTAKSWIDKYGRLSMQNYMHCYGTGTSTKPDIAFPLAGSKQGSAYAMSGQRYNIKVVMVPRWYEDSQDTPIFYKVNTETDPETGKIDTLSIEYQHNLMTFTLYYWTEAMIAKNDYRYTAQQKLEQKDVYWNGEKVDTITVFENVEFPVTYKNLRNTYPILRMQSQGYTRGKCPCEKNNDPHHSTYFNIDRIILEPVK
ncbi:MAG: hypothetical protein J6U46_06850 [Bacteroidaceae bacterium]|nr:hypothetical protein [Bacteroidaceae bacterium]